MAWADRIAYCCHDFEDAVAAGIVRPDDLPDAVRDVVGADRRTQLHRFITTMVDTIADTGRVGLRKPEADALDAFRAFNYERIYLRPEARDQADRVIELLAVAHVVVHRASRRDRRRADARWVSRGGGRGRALRQRDDRPVRVPARGRAAGLGSGGVAPRGVKSSPLRPG